MMNFHKALAVAVVGLALSIFTTQVSAQSWNVGYVFVAIGGGQYQVFDNSGNPIGFISNGLGGATAGCAFNSTFNLYTTDFTNSAVVVFGGTSTSHPILQTISVGATPGSGGSVDPESLTFDSSGNFYVGFADLTTTTVKGTIAIVPGGHLEKFNASGTLVATFTPNTENRGVDWTDLASNQSTFFYTSEGQKILRFDTVSGQLANFATLTGPVFALKLLPAVNLNNSNDLNLFDGSGGLLVTDTTDIKRLDGTGTVVQAYTAHKISDWVALALDPNGTSFWAGDGKTGEIFRFNINSGAIEVGPIFTAAGTNTMNGICVKGAHQQNIVPLPFSVGSNEQRFAAFGKPGSANYNTWTATVDTVTTAFTIAVSATERVDLTRTDEYFCNQFHLSTSPLTPFPCPTTFPPATAQPIAYFDQVDASGTPQPGHKGFYHIEDPPPTTDYGTNQVTVRFNLPPAASYTPLTCVVNGTPVATSNPRLFRAPSSPPPTDAGNNQFAFDYTLLYNSDNTILGSDKLNDYMVADRCPGVAGGTATFDSPLRGQPINLGRVIPIKVTVRDGSGNIVGTAVQFPNNIIGSIVGPDGKLEGFSTPGGSFSPFTPNGQSYAANLDTSGLTPGLTTICVTSIDENGAQALTNGGGGPGQFSAACTQIILQ